MAKLIIICLLLRILKSFAMPIIDPDSIDDSPACPPCENDFPTCYKVIVEVERGNGMPGSCCPRYECLDEEPVCDVSKRRFYKNKCTVCDPCDPLAIQCKETCPIEELEPNCWLPDINEYKRNGDVWLENNGCYNCICDGGKVSCNAVQCRHVYLCSNPIKVKGICCPICPEELGVSNDIFGDSNHEYRNSTSASILDKSESPSSESSSTVPTEISDSVPSTKGSVSSPSTSSEMATSTRNTSEVSSSTEYSITDSSYEQFGGFGTSESPDLKPDSEEQETSSDSPIETTTNPTTSDDLETSSVSSTFIELPTSTEDGITKMSFNDDNRAPKAIDEPTVILVTASNFSVATDNPITNQPAVPESTSQIKDLNSMEIQQITYPYAEVPQEHIQTDWPWECVVVMVLVIFLVLIFLYAIVKRYSISKKYHAIPLNPVRKLNDTEKTKAEQKL
ncbi:von Willebrand factor C and EGF domain-containing protein [Drosophila teissieri]|uniref:von Willebrand factor C and EGF domain-containing protein n=1 Tax=Drosophila teissieri TaxID=7243 RepID=UPI001CB9E86D|nr:von Willebrand factor C and EGF domain-containing protein [Drosophila teissieri]XP_043646573.1 von Willebrand factor C and EGF domain-containing protein [Drosophila teissieri]